MNGPVGESVSVCSHRFVIKLAKATASAIKPLSSAGLGVIAPP